MNRQQSIVLRKQLQQKLLQIPGSNLYQKLLIALMSVIWIVSTFSATIGAFIFMNPLFTCGNESKTEVEACLNIKQCHVENDFTGAYYMGLYCEQQIQRQILQSAYFIGCIAGMLILVPLSDSKGRRAAILIAFILEIIGIGCVILGIYTKVWEIVWFGHFCCGLFNSCIAVTSYVITGQYCNDRLRQKSIMFYCAMWGFGEMCYLPIYLLLREWYNFLILLVFIPSIGLFLICLFFIKQSPSFCIFNAKNLHRFKQSLQQVSVYNDTPHEQLLELQKQAKAYLQCIQKQNTQSKIELKSSSLSSLKQLLCVRQNAKICLCLALSQSAFNIYYYGMQGSMQRTGYNFGVSMFLAGLHQFIGYLISGLVVNSIPRKKGLIITILISSLVGLTLVFQPVHDSTLAESIVLSIARFCTVFGYSFVAMLQTESFAPEIISTGVGTTDGLSQISKVLVPYLVTAMNNLKIHPLIFSSSVYLVVGILPLMGIKQTYKGKKQKQNKDETQKQALKQSLNEQIETQNKESLQNQMAIN